MFFLLDNMPWSNHKKAKKEKVKMGDVKNKENEEIQAMQEIHDEKLENDDLSSDLRSLLTSLDEESGNDKVEVPRFFFILS